MVSRLWCAFFSGTNTLLAVYFCAVGKTAETIAFSLFAGALMLSAFITDEDLHEPWRKK